MGGTPFLIYEPGLHAARTYHFHYMGVIPIPPMLSSWSLWSLFLGFASNLEGNPYYIYPLLRPDWQNGTLNGDDSIWASALRLPTRDIGQ